MEDNTANAALLTVDMNLVYGMGEKEEVNMLNILTSLGHVVKIAHLETGKIIFHFKKRKWKGMVFLFFINYIE